MKKSYIVSYILLVFLLAIIPFFFDFATSIVPGWHFTIFTYFIWDVLAIIFLLFIVMAYKSLEKQGFYKNKTFPSLHFILTIFSMFFIRFSSSIPFKTNELPLPELDTTFRLFFFIIQLLFTIYFIRIVNFTHYGK